MSFKILPLFLKLIFFSLFFSLSSYKLLHEPKISDKKTIVVDLIHEQFDNDFFTDGDFYYTSHKLISFNYYPKYYQYLKDNYKGIPENDSISYYRCFEDRFLQTELYKFGDLSKEKEEWYLSHKDIDTLNFSKVKLKSTIIVVIGFYKNKQFMIADANRNKNFSDDVKFEYDINFRNNPYDNIDFLNNQQVADYIYEDCYKGNIQTYNRRFIIYPDKNNPYSISSRVNPKKEREYFSILKFRDFWKGNATINNEEIEFYYHGYSNRYGLLYVKPKDVPYKRNSAVFESQYSHKNFTHDKFDDTITIAGNRYKVDSINRDISKLYLREVGKKKYFGNEVGNYVKNIEFNDLESKVSRTDDIIGKKKYTLLEFWGTWCAPCVEMTPKVKEMQDKQSANMNIISIAVDEDIKKVRKYVAKHDLNWKFGFVPRKKSSENPIIKQLKIEYYPTFILIDSKGKIISRGGSDSIEGILRIIK